MPEPLSSHIVHHTMMKLLRESMARYNDDPNVYGIICHPVMALEIQTTTYQKKLHAIEGWPYDCMDIISDETEWNRRLYPTGKLTT